MSKTKPNTQVMSEAEYASRRVPVSIIDHIGTATNVKVFFDYFNVEKTYTKTVTVRTDQIDAAGTIPGSLADCITKRLEFSVDKRLGGCIVSFQA